MEEEQDEMGCVGDGEGDLEAGQHHELSGETIVGVSTLRVWLRHCVEQLVGEY